MRREASLAAVQRLSAVQRSKVQKFKVSQEMPVPIVQRLSPVQRSMFKACPEPVERVQCSMVVAGSTPVGGLTFKVQGFRASEKGTFYFFHDLPVAILTAIRV
jgi:hypothetical protein